MKPTRSTRAPDPGRDAVAEPWRPLGVAIRAYHEGRRDVVVRVTADGKEADRLPARHLFRPRAAFPDAEAAALGLCRGRVLDVGAGAGAHALELQRRGFEVVALDIAPEAVAVMAARGVRDARRGDVFRFRGERFDTLLLLMNGIGVVRTLAGLDRFLDHARGLVAPGGQILADSTDLRRGGDAAVRAAIAARRERGRYFGEVRFRMECLGVKGRSFGWLFVDPTTFARRARARGWRFQPAYAGGEGDYLARLAPR